MIDSDATSPTPDPIDPAPSQPSGASETKPAGPSAPSDEAPDRDTPAWEGTEPGESVGLVDPRHEIPTPPGL